MRYPGLALAWEALRAAPGSTAVLNAANEEAVAAFLSERIGFADIKNVISQALHVVENIPLQSLEDILLLDHTVRQHSEAYIANNKPHQKLAGR